MALSAGQETKDLRLVVQVLDEVTRASKMTADELKILLDLLDRASSPKGALQFRNLSGNMELFVEVLQEAGIETGQLQNVLDNVVRAVERLKTTGRFEFGIGDMGSVQAQAVGFETLEKRVLRAARAAKATKEEIQLITKELQGLQERQTVEGGVVKMFHRIQREGKITADVFDKVLRSAKLWRAEVRRQGRAAETGGTPFDGLDSTKGDKKEDVAVGKLLTQSRELYESILPGGKIAIDNVEVALKKMGLTLDDIGNITEDGARDIVRWTAAVETDEKITRRAIVTTTLHGDILKSTSRNLKTFGAGIIANIGKVAQWTAAIAIVYAPMRLLNDLTQQAIEIESKLADVQIALASGQESLNKVWIESTTVARELGIGVEGVIDGYVLAVRATADIIPPAEKAAATVAVLKDSMILAKLAGIDQAIAMDTLVGALRQLNLPLTEGTQLIDKWVAVSKAANVSLHTLAESFAITAAAAENVGLTMDELNGFIAAVAEVTTLSATESGNAVRAFISGFQRDNAERELDKFGISVRTVNGELRAFNAVIEDIIERKDIGLISDKELAKISEIIGGGARRGAQVNAFLENYSRVQQLAAVSANASGDAADAMAVKIQTLQSALENLNTAFSELARAFGTEAGFLDLVRGGVGRVTQFVDVLTLLVQQLGKATPAIIAFAAAWQYLRKSSRAQTFLDSPLEDILVSGGDPETKFRNLRARLLREARARDLGDVTPREAVEKIGGIGRGAVGGAAIGLGVALAAGNADLKRAGTTMGGAAVGQILAQGRPIGGLIGATIVTAIWSNLIDREGDLIAAWTRIFTGAYDATTDAATKPGEERDFFEEARGIIGGTNKPLGQDFGGLAVGIGAVALGKRVKPTQEDIENSTLAIMDAIIAVAEDRANLSQSILAAVLIGNLHDVRARYPEIKALVADMQKVASDALEAAEPGRAGKPFGLRLLGVQEGMGTLATQVFRQERETLLQEVARGQAGVRELTELLDVGNFELQVSTLAAGLTSLNAVGMEYIEIAEILARASEEEGRIFKRTANEIGALENKYRDLEAAYGDYIDQAGRMELADIANQIRDLQATLTEQLTVAGEGQRYKAFEMPSIIGVSPEATRRQLQAVVRDARKATSDFLDSMELKGPERQKVIDSYGELALQNVETFKIGMQGITDVSGEILEQMLEDVGLAADAAEQMMGFQQLDITAAQLPEFYGAIKYYEQLLEPTGLLKTEDLEKIVLLTSDHEVTAIETHSLLMSLAMQDLIDINEQQLEGIFNIPEGVTAAIPFTGKLYFSDQPIPTAGEGRYDFLGDAVDDLTGETSKGLVLNQQQVDALQLLLTISGGSETFLSNIEGLLREAGVEPEERGPVLDPITAEEALRPATAKTSANTVFAREMAEAFAAALAQSEQVNPELRLQRRFQEGGGFETPEKGGIEFRFGGEYWGIAADAISGAISGTFQELIDIFTGIFGLDEGVGGDGIGGITSEQVLSALPQSIPVNIQTRIINPVTVLVDGFQVATAMNERNYEDLQSATRRQGSVGYIMEA